MSILLALAMAAAPVADRLNAPPPAPRIVRRRERLRIYEPYGLPFTLGYRDYRVDGPDYAWPERLERDGDGALDYDRDYPFDHRYGGDGLRDGNRGEVLRPRLPRR